MPDTIEALLWTLLILAAIVGILLGVHELRIRWAIRSLDRDDRWWR